ncbi:hypothetical protein VTL71DRAFT_4392 [Oculimacula yallundae]|uniref:Uncharacterized protein n=1 Tax=Oculimacula yallundae TaxID=86028 RepID=A0ABR4C1T3_9HELO
MQLQFFLVSLLVATSAAADGAKPTSEKAQCNKIRKLERMIQTAANATLLQRVTHNDTAKMEAFQAKAKTAATELPTLTSNTTLVANCAIRNAARQLQNGCFETAELQAFIAFAGNATAVAQKSRNNTERAAKIQAKLPKATAELQTLMSNATLQAACPAIFQKEECKDMLRTERFIQRASNQTVIDNATKGNSTKADRIKKEVAQAQTQLDALKGNATFMAACAALGMSTGSKARGVDSAAQTSGTPAPKAPSGKNGAANVQVGGIQIAMLSTIIMVAAGMFML